MSESKILIYCKNDSYTVKLCMCLLLRVKNVSKLSRTVAPQVCRSARKAGSP